MVAGTFTHSVSAPTLLLVLVMTDYVVLTTRELATRSCLHANLAIHLFQSHLIAS